MKYFKDQTCKFNSPVITMGTFDGVHLGHRKLLEELKSEASKINRQSVVITYYHHPLEVIHKKTFPYLLTERNFKEKLIKEMGIDCVLYLDFTQKMAEMRAAEFLDKILIGELGASKIIVGYDTHFGRERMGNLELLEKYSEKFKIGMINPFKLNNRIVSSSVIRDLVREGDVSKAAKYLGRNYQVLGRVSQGHKIGRTIGFPTINIKPLDENKLIPGIGVYYCKVMINEDEFVGVTNVGYSPTLKTTGIKEIETHILDFDEDLYDKKVSLKFIDRIRDEINFESEKQLIAQIEKDITQTRNIFDM